MGLGAQDRSRGGAQAAAEGAPAEGAQGDPATQPATAPQDLDALLVAAGAATQPPPALSHAVPHVQQAYTWDCGLACVLMVLRALGMQQHSMATLLQASHAERAAGAAHGAARRSRCRRLLACLQQRAARGSLWHSRASC